MVPRLIRDLGSPTALIGIPSAEDIIKAFFGALSKIFGGSAQEAIENALNDIADNVPSLDLSDSTFDSYDGMFAIAMICGGLAMAVQLIRMIRLQDWDTLVDFAKILPITYIVGASLPYVASIAAGVLGDIHRGTAEWTLDRPLDSDTFDFSISGDFGFIELFIGWIGGWILNQESELFITLLPKTLLVLIVVFGLRWFGVLGDGLFVLGFGIALVTLVAPTAMVFTLCMFFLSAQDSYGATYVSVAVMVTAAIPFILLVVYFKIGLAQKVTGVMESRAMSTQISKRTHGSAASGGLAGKAAMAGAGAVAGSLAASYYGRGRDEDTSRTDHVRNMASSGMAQKATMAASTHPVTAAALLMGAQLVKSRPKKAPPQSPQPVRPPTPPPSGDTSNDSILRWE